MVTKADENKAWKRLVAYPHGAGTRILELERASYRDDGKPMYKAYIAAAKPHGWTGHYESPMEAVDAVIRMMETTREEAANATDPA